MSWHPFSRIDDGFAKEEFSSVAAIARNPDSQDLFVSGTDGGVYSTWWESASGWAYWFRIDEGFDKAATSVAVVARNPDSLDLFVTGSDGGVYSTWWDGAGGWAYWFRIDEGFAQAATSVAAVTRNPDSLDLFVTGSDGRVYWTWWRSTSGWAVYGVPAVVPTSEEAPYAPINPYGETKMVCERMLAEYALAFPLSFVSLRYFNAAGADPEGEIGPCQIPATHAIQLLLDAAAGESPGFTIYGDDYPTADGTGVRDYIHVTDLADAHVKALSALLAGAENAVLNLGTGRGWSVRELVATVREVTGCDFPVRVGARRPGDPPALVANASRARHQLGWRPRYADLTSQVTHAWAWRQGDRRTWKRMQTQSVTYPTVVPQQRN